MKSSPAKIRNLYAKNYIQAVFAQRLMDEGFVCPDDKMLNWYRVRNSEVVNSVVFFSPWKALPLIMYIGHGIHPLFTFPEKVSGVCPRNRTICEETFSNQPITESEPSTLTTFSEDALVLAPNGGSRGLYTLDHLILPKMDRIETIEDCYQLHKDRYLAMKTEESKKFRSASSVFIDEAIYVGDTSTYPYLENTIHESIRILEICCQKYPRDKYYREAIDRFLHKKKAIIDGDRDDYLTILEQRKQVNMKTFKKYGVIV